jgi:hypothetical protein
VSTVHEEFEAEIAAIQAKAAADIQALQAKAAALPPEVHSLSSETWAAIKSFFTSL